MLRQLSGFESKHRSKIHNKRHKQRSGQHTLARKKREFFKKKLGDWQVKTKAGLIYSETGE